MTLTIEDILQKTDANSSKILFKKLAETTICPICHDHMFAPHMTRCGHNFCYGCLTVWLNHNTSCPTCRSGLHEEPFFNVQLRDLSNTLLEMCQKIADDELIDIVRHRQLQVEAYTKDEKTNKKFKNIFDNMGQAVVDLSDGVARCSNCHWEVHGDRCPNCNITIGNRNRLDVVSDDDTDFGDHLPGFHGRDPYNTSDEEDMGNYDSEAERIMGDAVPDEDDLAFVVDDDDSDVEDFIPFSDSDNYSDDYGDSGNDGDSNDANSAINLPARRRYIPTFVSDDEQWQDTRSFRDDSDAEDQQSIQRNSRFDHDSDNENENENEEAESWNGFQTGSDVEAALSAMDVEEDNPYEADSEEDSNINRVRRIRNICISEDEDDDDDD